MVKIKWTCKCNCIPISDQYWIKLTIDMAVWAHCRSQFRRVGTFRWPEVKLWFPHHDAWSNTDVPLDSIGRISPFGTTICTHNGHQWYCRTEIHPWKVQWLCLDGRCRGDRVLQCLAQYDDPPMQWSVLGDRNPQLHNMRVPTHAYCLQYWATVPSICPTWWPIALFDHNMTPSNIIMCKYCLYIYKASSMSVD